MTAAPDEIQALRVTLKADEAAVQFRKMGVTDAEQRALALAADSRGRTRSVSGRARLELS